MIVTYSYHVLWEKSVTPLSSRTEALFDRLALCFPKATKAKGKRSKITVEPEDWDEADEPKITAASIGLASILMCLVNEHFRGDATNYVVTCLLRSPKNQETDSTGTGFRPSGSLTDLMLKGLDKWLPMAPVVLTLACEIL